MKLTKTNSLITLVLLIGSVAWLAGCGDSAAEPAENAEAQSSETSPDFVADPVETEAERLAAEQTALNERLAAVERREAEVIAQERRAAERQRESSRPVVTSKPVPRTPPATPTTREVAVTLPASTPVSIEFTQALSSDESVVGDPVNVIVATDVVQDGHVVIPAGAEVTGEVVQVKSGRKIGGRSRLGLRFESLSLPDGRRYPLQSDIDYAGKNQTGKDAATIGGSTAGGALLGRVLGGDDKGKSTAIGAVVGAAVGTAVASKNGTDSILIQTGDLAELLLYEPLRITVKETENSSAWAKK